ncbi:SsgA family sporulation/cell division regulator [Streptomyces mangrovisoli]|uniref:Sporulation protein SsgA n=1 Tax=Streptomyces mangrovisoli TaxID=1428628 RepID=A0A1J4NYU0_9ACTN|nr:SsgA family sporulation/cell division regulator [Streptomyces mangrovisoli]OIJ67655.1 sporulation protein SsgA [Streptomyces mangrovisoli]
MQQTVVVEREVELRLVLSPERSIPVPARLAYRGDDPYAVHIAFHIRAEHPVRWTFARELLVEGVFRPCGYGDVRVWPAKADGRCVVLLALSSPDGDALLEAPSAQLSAWLERTLVAVPPGTESDRLALDDALAGLLDPAAPGRPAPRERAARPRPQDVWLREARPSDECPEGE